MCYANQNSIIISKTVNLDAISLFAHEKTVSNCHLVFKCVNNIFQIQLLYAIACVVCKVIIIHGQISILICFTQALTVLTCTSASSVLVSLFIPHQRCRGLDQRCLWESRRFTGSSFALSASVTWASLLKGLKRRHTDQSSEGSILPCMVKPVWRRSRVKCVSARWLIHLKWELWPTR